MLIGKQPAVDIGKGSQIIVHIGVPVLRPGIQHLEQIHQGTAGVALVALHIVVKFAVTPENLRVLGVQAEHQPDAQGVQALQRLRGFRVLVLLQKRIVQGTHDLTGLQGDLHLLFDIFVPGVHQEIQAVIFLLQVGQGHNFRLVIRAVHVVDVELPEIAYHDPPGVLVVGQIARVTAGLLIGRQHGAVGLLVAPPQVDVRPLLLNEDTGILDISVNEADMVQLHRTLKLNGLLRLRHTVDIPKQVDPETLGLLLLVAPACPIGCKLLRRRPLLHICHDFRSSWVLIYCFY